VGSVSGVNNWGGDVSILTDGSLVVANATTASGALEFSTANAASSSIDINANVSGAPLRITGTSGTDDPAIGATVTFTTVVEDQASLTGTFKATAVSDDSGIVSVDLIPGNTWANRLYEVTIITPPTSTVSYG